MFNVMLDRLPSDWHGYRIDTDFRTGIQIMRCLSDGEFSERERIQYAVSRLFQGNIPDIQEAVEGLAWYMSEYNHDNHSAGKENGKIKAYDFDVDQWRIYSAFRRQYGIDLNHAGMHWFVFMGLLTNLEECSFTRVVDIRLRKAVRAAQRKGKNSGH